MDAQTVVALSVVLALEPVAGETPARLCLTRDEAAELAALVATDLQTLVPQMRDTRLGLAGALFDQVELLRPGFPVWATLDDLTRRVPRGQLDHVIAFGSHDGQMPAPPLQPATDYADGPMRLLPLTVLVAADAAETLSDELETQLVGRGEAGPLTADWLMRTLGIRLEHLRYLSRNDLLAMTCVQYEHVNLASLWTLLEAALLTPFNEETALSARGLRLRYANGTVQVQSPSQWLTERAADATGTEHDFAGILFELRQYAALLHAHHLSLQLMAGTSTSVQSGEGYLLETLTPSDPAADVPQLFAHEAPGLGVVAITVAQRSGAGARVLAHAYPLAPQALGPLLGQLAEQYGTAGEVHTQGRITLDEHGHLAAPTVTLH